MVVWPKKKEGGLMSKSKYRLTAELIQGLCKIIEAGVPPALAAQSEGIPAEVFNAWLERGSTARSGKFKELTSKIRQAEAVAECALIIDSRIGAREGSKKGNAVALKMLGEIFPRREEQRLAADMLRNMQLLKGRDPRAICPECGRGAHGRCLDSHWCFCAAHRNHGRLKIVQGGKSGGEVIDITPSRPTLALPVGEG